MAISHALRGKADSVAPISIRLRREVPNTYIPADFIGLGYEKSSVAVAGLLSAENDRYVQLITYIPHISDSISRQFRGGHPEPS
jgi:hypothetical protein